MVSGFNPISASRSMKSCQKLKKSHFCSSFFLFCVMTIVNSLLTRLAHTLTHVSENLCRIQTKELTSPLAVCLVLEQKPQVGSGPQSSLPCRFMLSSHVPLSLLGSVIEHAGRLAAVAESERRPLGAEQQQQCEKEGGRKEGEDE